LPLKVLRKNSSLRIRTHKKKLGRSIDERAESVNEREEFGHLECDLIVGKISDDDVILNIVERRTRYSFVYKLADKKVSSVMKALDDFRNLFGESFNKIFHTITTDNGSEFSSLAELEKISKILVYFAHPYSSWEKGSVENLNGLLRRFIPKGKSIRDFSAEYISKVVFWANSMPRKILQYATAEECFLLELKSALIE
ncbi:MAG: IS30 family transposase, partial [Selenomonadaceae bacterium]|nr:IS30 family transposase [Selenomonadaceae bacterium]